MDPLLLLTLLALVGAVIAAPMLPAWREWRHPTDIQPLPIDSGDALDPAHLALRFTERLAEALRQATHRLGRTEIVTLDRATPPDRWPLSARELASGQSRRIWHTSFDASLPAQTDFLREVAVRGSLSTATGGVYRALVSARHLELQADSVVIRWAHGHSVAVGDGCVLAGRVTAQQAIVVGRRVRFSLLHAPAICFAGGSIGATGSTAFSGIGADEGVTWDAAGTTAHAATTLTVPPLRRWRGDLVCDGDLHLAEGCEVTGSLRVQGHLTVAAGTVISGSVLARGEVYLAPGSRVEGSVLSETLIEASAGSRIGAAGLAITVQAPGLNLHPDATVLATVHQAGRPVPRPPTVRTADEPTGGLPPLSALEALESRPPPDTAAHPAPPPGLHWEPVAGRLLSQGDLRFAATSRWQGDVVCRGDLHVGAGCRQQGAIKAYGDVEIDAGCEISGSVFAQGAIRLGAGVRVRGSVVSETAVVLGPGVRVGATDAPATVNAPAVEVALGVIVHGSVWAGENGGALGAIRTPAAHRDWRQAPLAGRAAA